MSTGLLALLDDVAALVKLSAASLDDIPSQIAKTSGKVSGLIIDDAAVTPKYVVGLDPARELAIIYRIARSSLVNKLLFVGPAALFLGYVAPWLIQPILMLGGGYLCYEGYEKLHSMFAHRVAAPVQKPVEIITPEALEKKRIASAVSTDFILSAEIIAITYSTVADKDLLTQIVVVYAIAVGITALVYGVVGLIVKLDDIGVHIAKFARHAFLRKLGRGLVKAMPGFLQVLGTIGTAAMLWVGAGIIAHGIPFLHHALQELEHSLTPPILGWSVAALMSAIGGVAVGAVIDIVLRRVFMVWKRMRA